MPDQAAKLLMNLAPPATLSGGSHVGGTDRDANAGRGTRACAFDEGAG